MKFLSNILFIDKIWGDKVSANKWLLPLSILTAALTGAIFGGGVLFGQISNFTLVAICGSLIMLWGYNLAESIIASTTPLVAFGRSVPTLVMIVGIFALSCVASIVVLVAVALLLLAMVMLFFANGALKGGGSGSSGSGSNGDCDAQIVNEHGGTVNLKDHGTIMQGDDGHKYRRTTGGVERLD